MQLIPMQGNSDVTLIACAVSNVCNATLSLLCTASLFFWGVVVNRRQAWRTDGGTAAFGAGTLFLSVLGTGLNFLYIPREEEYLWLPGLIWAVVLWQSFLGWWWWVGAGSGGGVMDEKDGKGRVEEMMSREEKRQRRRQERTDKRQERKDKAKSMWKGVAGAFGSKDDGENSSTRSVSTMQQLSPSTSTASDGQSDIPYTPPNIFHRWCSVVRHAHQTAAREQAEERIERIREMERGNLVRTRAGWGIGSFESSVGGRRELSQTRSPNRGEKEMEMEMEKVTDGSYGEGGVERAGRTQRQDMQSITWWGPLRRWRLQDSTVYSRSAAG